jgi:hypothetical protein
LWNVLLRLWIDMIHLKLIFTKITRDSKKRKIKNSECSANNFFSSCLEPITYKQNYVEPYTVLHFYDWKFFQPARGEWNAQFDQVWIFSSFVFRIWLQLRSLFILDKILYNFLNMVTWNLRDGVKINKHFDVTILNNYVLNPYHQSFPNLLKEALLLDCNKVQFDRNMNTGRSTKISK